MHSRAPPGHRFRATLMAVLVAGFGIAGAGPAAAVHKEDDPGCGNLSPFRNVCMDPEAVDLSRDPRPSVSILGFQGRIQVTLLKQPGAARMDWVCDALLAAPLSGECVLVFRSKDLEVRDDVLLFCHAMSHPAFGPLVPPTGSWGCEVDM